ncbi:WD40 repeat domain-containing protein [Streptomyces mayteni]
MSLLVILSLIATVVAVRQQRIATAAEAARSRQLATQSAALLTSDPDLAALLAIEAYRTSPTTEATTSLYAAAALPLRHRLVGHTGSVYGVAFSPDGSILTTSSGHDHALRRWDTATGRLIETIEGAGESSFGNPVYSPDGRLFTTLEIETGEVTIRDAVTGEAVSTLSDPFWEAGPSVFSVDGSVLATTRGRYVSPPGTATVRLYDTATGQQVPSSTALVEERDGVALSGDLYASVGFDRSVRIQGTATGHTVATVPHDGEEASLLAFSPDGQVLATASLDGIVHIRDADTGRSLVTFNAPGRLANAIAFNADGTTLATAGLDGGIVLWDVGTGRSLVTFNGHTGTVFSLRFSPDGATLASAGEDGTARLWNVPPGRGSR